MKRRNFTLWPLVWLLSQFVSLVSVTLLFSLGLILIEFLLYPLALAIAALLTGLTAVYASNRLIRDGWQTPVQAVVRWCEGTAVILSILLIMGNMSGSLPTPPIVVSSISAVILAVVATVSAHQLRQMPLPNPQRPRRVLVWLLLALLALPVVIFLASLFGWAGA